MITRVWSDLEHFREVEFCDGMNVVVAEQAEDFAETESTNGLGKTTLIRIIQFCFGSDLSKDKVLNHPDLKGVTFGVDFSYRGDKFTVSRSTSKGGHVVSVSSGFIGDLPVEVLNQSGDLRFVELQQWHSILTHRFLYGWRSADLEQDINSPSFRELSY